MARDISNTYWFRSGLPEPVSRSRDGVILTGIVYAPGNGVDSISPPQAGRGRTDVERNNHNIHLRRVMTSTLVLGI